MHIIIYMHRKVITFDMVNSWTQVVHWIILSSLKDLWFLKRLCRNRLILSKWFLLSFFQFEFLWKNKPPPVHFLPQFLYCFFSFIFYFMFFKYYWLSCFFNFISDIWKYYLFIINLSTVYCILLFINYRPKQLQCTKLLWNMYHKLSIRSVLNLS